MYITESMCDFEKNFPKMHEAMDDLMFSSPKKRKSFYDLCQEGSIKIVNAYIMDMCNIDIDWLYGIISDVKYSLDEALEYNRFSSLGEGIQKHVRNEVIIKVDHVMFNYEEEMMTPFEKKRRGRFYGMPDIEQNLLDGTAFR